MKRGLSLRAAIVQPCRRALTSTHAWAAIALTAGCLFAYWYYLEPPPWPRNFGLHDDRYFFGPNAYYLDACLKHGEFPFWNPLTLCGQPFSADPQANACYPPHLVRSLLTPAFNPYATAVGMQILLLLHVLLSGMGVYVLARQCGAGFWGSLAGGFIFMLGPFSLIYTMEFYVFALVTSWLPWVVCLARRAFRARCLSAWIGFTALASLCFGVSTLGGFPQLTMYMGLTLAVFAYLDGFLHLPWWGLSEIPRQVARVLVGRTFFLGVIAFSGALVAAFLLLPAEQYARHSARIASAGLSMYAFPQSKEWGHLLKCLVAFPGNTWLPQGCRAAGIGSLLALLAALACPRNRRDAALFAGLYAILTDCTLGPPFPVGSLLHSIDFLNITVSPWRAGVFSSFGLAVVAAIGVDAAGNAAASRLGAMARTVLLLAAGLFLLHHFGHWVLDKPLYSPGVWVWRVPLTLLVAAVCLAWIRLPRLGPATLGLLIIAEVLAWSHSFVPQYMGRTLHTKPTDRLTEASDLSQSNWRTAASWANWHQWNLDMAVYGYGPLYVGQTRQTLCAPSLERSYQLGVGVDEAFRLEQRANLFAKRTFWLARKWVSGPLPGKEDLFPACTTVFLPECPAGTELSIPEMPRDKINRSSVSPSFQRVDLGTRTEFQRRARKFGKDEMLWELPPYQQERGHSALCISYTAAKPFDFTAYCTDKDGVEHKLKQTRAEAGAHVERHVEIPLPDLETSHITLKWPQQARLGLSIEHVYAIKDLSDEDGLITIDRRRANSVDLTVDGLPDPRFLVFVDSFYPGWRAWVDGNEVQILRADDAFKAIAVPAGTHKVRFAYTPALAYAGVFVSGFSSVALLGAAALSFAAYRRRELTRFPGV